MPSTSQEIAITGEPDVHAAAHQSKALARSLGFGEVGWTCVQTAVYELARNMLRYAGGGSIHLEPVSDDERRGLRVVAVDHGPGIADVERAMEDGYSTSEGLGTGLPAVRRLMDEFTIESKVGEGTRVTTVKWLGK